MQIQWRHAWGGTYGNGESNDKSMNGIQTDSSWGESEVCKVSELMIGDLHLALPRRDVLFKIMRRDSGAK